MQAIHSIWSENIESKSEKPRLSVTFWGLVQLSKQKVFELTKKEYLAETVDWSCSAKNLFLNIWQNSQENVCVEIDILQINL